MCLLQSYYKLGFAHVIYYWVKFEKIERR